jgi:hypothetical protein
MILNTADIDAYIAKKGLVALLTEQEWRAILQRVSELFGRPCYRLRLVNQAEDPLRRLRMMPLEGPFRFIGHIDLLVWESAQLVELKEWLTQRCVRWCEHSVEPANARRNPY